MEIAAILFVLTAPGGGGIATMRLAGRPRPPTWVALMHGGLAAISIGFLGYVAATSGVPTLGQIALGVFVSAALGGGMIFLLFHLRGKPLPIPLVIGHGLFALL